MIDLKLIRENPDFVKENLKKRNDPTLLKMVDEVRELDVKWREVISQINELRRKRNELSIQIAKLKSQGKEFNILLEEAKNLPQKIKELERKKEELENRITYLLLRIPNLIHESVPYGKDENENVEIRRWGKPPTFNFEPKDHLTILKELNLIEQERANKIAGHGFFFFKEKLVLLDLAIQRFAIDFLRKKGFVLVYPPLMMKREFYEGVTSLEDFDLQLYKIDNQDLHLIATSEHPIAAMHANEVFLKDELPKLYCGLSVNFRKEVGAHGKYTKGLFRMHQFHKVEQFVFSLPEESWEWHEILQKNAEKLYQKLGLHYRVVNVCTGDLGVVAAKKYDIEVWMVDGKFREAGSNSNCTDYQARRLNIRYREKEGAPVKGYVHTLNSTALATSRTMLAIIEQYQQKDGSVKIPKVLWKYCSFKKLEKEEEKRTHQRKL